MRPVVVLIFHAPPLDAGPLTRVLDAARSALAEAHRAGFLAAGAADVRIIADAGDRPFGARLRSAVAGLPPAAGAVILGSGSLPLASIADRRRFVEAAADDDASAVGAALANNRYSGDVVALPDAAAVLATLPDLPGDNALPRWLSERRGLRVSDLRGRPHLQADLDGPADLLLLAGSRRLPAGLRALVGVGDPAFTSLRDRLAAVEAVAGDPRAEIVVTGRLSAAGLAHLERATACRIRAIVEERGLRAASPLAQGEPDGPAERREPDGPGPVGTAQIPADDRSADDRSAAPSTSARPSASILGITLDGSGPAALGSTLARLGDAAIVDTRVLLAHRLGADERRWPRPEDRFASDLLLPDRIEDPWLRALTESAVAATIPVILGGHSLVGPGLWLLFSSRTPVIRPADRSRTPHGPAAKHAPSPAPATDPDSDLDAAAVTASAPAAASRAS